MNQRKKLFAILLSVMLMLTSLIPNGIVHAVDGGAPAAAELTAEETVKATKAGTVLAFTSDVHNQSNNTAANRLDTWIKKIVGIYGGIDAMAFGGDMADASASSSTFWTYTQAGMNKLTNNSITGVYTTGNHEHSPGRFSSSSTNETQQAYVINKTGAEGDNYIIYCLGSVSGSSSYASQISSLRTYLANAGNDKPIFIITHFPLHFCPRKVYSDRITENAADIIDVLNEAVTVNGQKIVFLWGHNHTESDEYYDYIYRPEDTIVYDKNGNSKTINFYYGAAGCMSDSEYGSGSEYAKGKGLVVEINSKNQLKFTYHDANGNNVTEGGSFTEQDPVAVEAATIDEASENGSGQGTTAIPTIEAGKTLQLHYTTVPSDATVKSVTWNSNNKSVATVSSSGKVKGVNPGTATITATISDGITRGFVTTSVDVTVTERTSEEQYYVISIEKNNVKYALSSHVSSEMMSNSSGYEYHGLDAVVYSSDDPAPYSILWTLESVEDVENGYYIKSYKDEYLSGTYVAKPTGSGSIGTLTVGDTKDVWIANGGFDAWGVAGSTLQSTNSSSSSKALYLGVTTSNNNAEFFTVRSSSDSTVPRTSVLAEPDSILEPIAVTGITLSLESLALEAGKSAVITANVLPQDSDDKTVTWVSSDENVATVSDSGRVKGISAGTAVITATTNDGGYQATCVVTVTPSSAPGIGYVIQIGDYALSVEPSSDILVNSGSGTQEYHYTGLLGVEYDGNSDPTDDILWLIEPTEGGYHILSQDGRYLNATYTANNTGGNDGILKLDDTPDVWTINGSLEDWVLSGSTITSTNSGKAITHEEGSTNAQLNLFTVRSTGESSSMVDPDTPAEVRFVETNVLSTGKDYIVAVTKDGSSVYAIENVGGTTSADTGSSILGNNEFFAASGSEAAYIVTSNTGVIWNYNSNKYLANNNRYLSRGGSSGAYVPRASGSGSAVTYDSSNRRLSISYSSGWGSGTTYYLTNSSGTFGLNASTSDAAQVRLFEKATVFNFKYVIQFVSNGVNYKAGKYAEGEIPVYDGVTPTREETEQYTYAFSGWSSDGGTTVYSPEDALPAVTGPITYVAQFTPTPKSYTVTFDSNGGSTVDSQTVAYNGTISTPETAPVKEGYTFAGWYSNEELTTAYDFTAPVTGNITLYARWTVIDYSITYDLAGGTVAVANPANYTIESDDITLNNPTKTGYTFAGWTGTGLDGATETVMITKGSMGDRAYTATWTSETYTVTFNSNGGSAVDSQTVAYNSSATAPETAPVKEGYNFAGWYSDEELTTAFDFTAPVTGNITLYAKWTAVEYMITYDLAGGTVATANPASYTIESEVITLNNPTKTGYTFAGWTGTGLDGATETVMITKGSTGDRAYTATWTPETYTITYEANGGNVSEGAVGSYTIESADITLTEATRTGYTFAGWYDNAEFSGEAVTKIAVGSTGDKTFYAKWTANTYTVTFDKNDEEATGEMSAQSFIYDVGQALTANGFAKANYTFAGWATSADGNVIYTDKESVKNLTDENDGSVKLYAVWTQNSQVTVTYDANGGTGTMNAQTIYKDVATALNENIFTREGYSFNGWNTMADGSGTAYIDKASVTLSEDTMLYAQWNAVEYTITYDLAGGAVEKANPAGYTIESDSITLNNPIKTGYIFAGWIGTGLDGATGTVTITKGSTGDRAFTATWTLETYTITYEANGGNVSEGAAGSYTVESEDITLAEATKTGYTFAGWYDNAEFSGEAVTKIAAGSTGNKTFYAKWTAVEYTITYDLAGGTVAAANPAGYTIESDDITLNNPTKTGYTFAGWTGTGLDGAAGTVTIAKGSTGNREYTATWTPEIYTITYEANGGNVSEGAAGSYTVESADITLAEATRTGYTFAGWYDNAEFSGEAVTKIAVGSTGDKTFYAKWSVVEYTITYDLAGGTVAAANPASYTIESEVITLNNPTKTGYTFAGWTGTGLDDATVTVTIAKGSTGDRTYTAIWTSETYTVTFNSNGGSAVDSQTVAYNGTVTEPEIAPTKEGYTFAGWYSDEELTTSYDFTTLVTGSIILYAKWEAEVIPEGTRYIEVTVLEAGEDYVLGAINTDGTVSAITYDGGNVSPTVLRVYAEDGDTFVVSEDSAVVWQFTDDTYFYSAEGDRYLYPYSRGMTYATSGREFTFTEEGYLSFPTSSNTSFITFNGETFNYAASGAAAFQIFKKVVEKVAVTGVTVDGTATVEVGATVKLTATISPEDATDKNVIWTSSDEAIATVDKNGIVTGVAAGEAMITVTTVDGSFTAICTVTVTEPAPATMYKLTDRVKVGKNYLVVSSNEAGTAYAVKDNGNASGGIDLDSTAVTVSADGNNMIIATNVSNIVWTASANNSGTGFDLSQNGDYLQFRSGSFKISNPIYNKDRYWTYENYTMSQLISGGSSGSASPYYLYWNNSSFTSSSSLQNIYLYEEVSGEHTHTYDAATFSWAEDNSTCTAAMTCSDCTEDTEGHTVSETVDTDYEVTKAATCEEAGIGTYTATFTNTAFAVQTKTAEIPATGHDWEAAYTWAADFSSVTAEFTCKNCSHTETVIAAGDAISDEVTTEPTADAPGEKTYTATITFDGKTFTTSRTETIPATGVTVSGTVVSFCTGHDHDDEDGIITLTLTRAGEQQPVYTTTAATTETTPATELSAQYSFTGVAEGTYTLTVVKAYHAARTYEVVVTAGENVELAVKIHLMGDINGDGELTNYDFARTNSHAREVTFLDEYEFACADINGDGEITNYDAARINSQAREVTFIW